MKITLYHSDLSSKLSDVISKARGTTENDPAI